MAGAKKKLETTVRISNDIDQSIQKAIDGVVANLTDLQAAARKAGGAAGELAGKIQDQGKVLEVAQQKYASFVVAGEESTEQAQKLAREIADLSDDLRKNKSALAAAEKAAKEMAGETDDAEKSVDDLGDAAKKSKGGFTVMKGALADLVSKGIQTLVGAARDAVSSVYGLAESTREFRQDMGTLETAYSSAGFSAETATETWKDLYSVFGEDDRAVEAANNIARLATNQKDLEQWTKITTGIWGTYQDALPVESLAESAGETAKVGKVTGALADALNWNSDAAKMFSKYMGKDATNAEEAFNVALSKCSTEAERNALITETLSKLYGGAAEEYEKTAGSVMEANAATADLSLKQAELGERIEPITTAVTIGFGRLLDKVLELTENIDMEALAEKVANGFDKVGGAIEWVVENADILIPIIGGLTTAFLLFKAASALTSLATSGVSLKLMAIIGVVGAVVGAVIWLYKNWDTAKEKLLQFGGKVSEIWGKIAGWISGAIERIGEKFPIFGAYLEGWWKSIQDAVANVKAIFEGVIDFISNVFSGNWEGAWDNIVSIFGNIFGTIGNLAKAPINGLIGIINKAIDGINSIGIDLPDWLGGKSFSFNIPPIPMLASGGFTSGVSIAGEAGTEAVISFDPAYHDQNVSYWAQAGRMLGLDPSYSLSGSSGGSYTSLGGVTFAPNITVQGSASKDDIVEAIREAYPEFLDMLDELLADREEVVYA